jgi:uncharacterized membrane protein YkoI
MLSLTACGGRDMTSSGGDNMGSIVPSQNQNSNHSSNNNYSSNDNYSSDNKNDNYSSDNNSNVKISEAEAKNIALKEANVKEDDIDNYKCKLEKDNGVWEYDISFHVGNVEHDYEIDANTGKIIDKDKDIED